MAKRRKQKSVGWLVALVVALAVAAYALFVVIFSTVTLGANPSALMVDLTTHATEISTFVTDNVTVLVIGVVLILAAALFIYKNRKKI